MLKNKIDYDCLHNYSDAIGWHYMLDRILFTQQDRMSIDAAMHFDQLLSFQLRSDSRVSLVRPFVRPSVRPSVRPFVRSSVRPSVRQSVRPSVRSSVAFFLIHSLQAY